LKSKEKMVKSKIVKNKIRGGFFVKRKLFGAIATAFLVLGLAACSAQEETAKKVSSSNSKTTETKKEEPQVFKIGDTVQLGDNVLTVTKVDKSAGNEFDKPKQGNEYVIVHVRIENHGKDTIDYNPYDFKLKNSNGQLVDPAVTSIGSDTALDSGQLDPNGKVEGTIAFEAPQGDKGLQLQYTPSFWDNKKIMVNLQ
jgi:hypothetical protein